MEKRIIEGIVVYDHAGYGMCIGENGAATPPANLKTMDDLLPEEFQGKKVRITVEVLDPS